jgi:RNA polymerase sigma-70 factor (ECF subfamily)
MSEAGSFADLVARVRAGDDDAAADLVRRCEATLARVVRIRLHHSRLRNELDSADVCQSVLGSFFVRLALGQYDVESAEALARLLAVMARNKIADRARRRALPRSPGETVLDDLAAADPSPSRQAAGRELLARVREALTEEERRLADGRAAGRAWTDLAAERGPGTSPEALRKQLARAIDRVARDLGWEE